jgi:hypothetical protein
MLSHCGTLRFRVRLIAIQSGKLGGKIYLAARVLSEGLFSASDFPHPTGLE